MRLNMAWVLMLGLLATPAARADPPTSVQIEVNFLLGYLDGSGCEFFRNGTWHDSRAAQLHLRGKYTYLMARNLVDTAEAFIERAATQSSLSGQAYAVRCSGSATVTSKQWLGEVLERFRRF